MVLAAFWRAERDPNCSRRWLRNVKAVAIGAMSVIVVANAGEVALRWWLA